MCKRKEKKKKLQGKGHSINESLETLRMESLLKQVIVLVSSKCGLKTGKLCVRKTTEIF